MSTNDTSAAGAIVQFIDGTEYRIRPLCDEDMDLLSEWCQLRMINMVEASLPKPCSQDQYDLRMGLAIREAARITWQSEQGRKQLRSIDGLVFMLWLGIREDHPTVTKEMLKAQLKNVENTRRFNLMWRKANDLKKGVSTTAPSPNPLELDTLPKARSTRSSPRHTTGRRK